MTGDLMTTVLTAALGLLLQSTVLLASGLLALWLARRRGPAVQTLIGRATLVGVALTLLALPLSGRVRPLWRVSVPDGPAVSAEGDRVPPAPDSGGAGTEMPPVAAPPLPPPVDQPSATALPPDTAPAELPSADISPAPPPERPAPRPSPLRLLYAALTDAWGTGTALLLLWLGLCQWHLTRLRRTASVLTSGPAADALAALSANLPRLLTHPAVRSPFLAGIVHPAIFLPDSADTDFTSDALRAILAHELAHLARRDNAWTLFCRVLCAVLWPQALLWVLCRRLEAVGEEACDQAVLAQDCPPRTYAACLLTLAERHPLGRRERALGAGVAPFRSSLGRRVQRILDKGTHAMSAVSTRLRLTIAALTLAAVVGGVFLVSSAPAETQPVQTHTDKPSLVGMWLGPSYGGERTVLIFSADGHVEQVGTWPGDKSEVAHEYGQYTTSGPSMTWAMTRTRIEGQPSYATWRQLRGLTYDLSGDILTLHLKHSWTQAHKRITSYTDAMLGVRSAGGRAARADQRYSSTPAEVRQYLDLLSAKEGHHPAPDLSHAEFLAGLTPVQGPGVVVTLDDSTKPLPSGLPGNLASPNIIHESDINHVVNELKAAGAEAISVSDQRLVATSPIRDAGPTIFVNNVPQTPPYAIKAIGDPKVLAAALNIRSGIASQLKAFDPAMFSVRETTTLKLPAYSGATEPRYARPASSGPDTAKPDLNASRLEQSTNNGVAAAQSIHFLDGQIADRAAKMRRAEMALTSYRARHPNRLRQRYFVGLMRDYHIPQQEYANFRQRRFAMQVQLDLDRMSKGPQVSAPAHAVTPPLPTSSTRTTPPAAMTRQVIGYGLWFSSFGKKRVCSAIKGSVAARAGIPVDGYSVIASINGKPTSVSESEFQTLIHSSPPLRLTLESNGKRIGPFTLTEKGSYSVQTEAGREEERAKELKESQAKSAAAKQAVADTEQQLKKEIQAALPQADPRTLATAYNVEQRVGWQIHRVNYCQEYKAWCLKKKNSVSYGGAIRDEARVGPWLKQALQDEAKTFPGTSQSQLSHIHVLAGQLSDREMNKQICVIEASAFASVARARPWTQQPDSL